jgi:hypothetical protein
LRVLRRDGLLLVTTPNRLTFSPGLDAPVNPFHTKEFTAAELVALLAAHGFTLDQTLGLHAGRRIAELDERYGGLVPAQLAGAPADWPRGLLADVARIAATDFPVVPATRCEIDEALDLVLLARPRI